MSKIKYAPCTSQIVPWMDTRQRGLWVPLGWRINDNSGGSTEGADDKSHVG